MPVDLLVFGPHPDDIEIGLGGTIARQVADGVRVGLCDLTAGEMGSNGAVEERLAEAEAARLVLGASMNLQAPPNLTGDYARLLDAGINDWGGVSPLTADFINPEAPWPHLASLRAATRARGFLLRQRLPVYPEYILGRPAFLPPELSERIRACVDGDGLVAENGD